MLINQLEIFDGLALLAKSSVFGDNLTNRKTKPYLSMIPYLEFVVLPLNETVKGKGSLTRVMSKCCSLSCRFLPKELKPKEYEGFKGYCNQSRAVNAWLKQVNKLAENQALIKSIELKGYQARLTSFGDIGRLNDDGLNHIERIIENSSSHLAYSAAWRDSRLARFQGKFQASVGNLDEAMEAYNLGFMPYGLTREDNLKFRLLTGVPVYACPYDTTTFKGCSTCEIRCNGERAVSLKEKRL